MAITFGTYNFTQDVTDGLNGTMPADFTASYLDVEVAMFEGTIVLENEKKGSRFDLVYQFTDGITLSVDDKLDDLLALRGTVDVLSKGNSVLTGVMLKNVTIQSRIACTVPFLAITTTPENITAIVSFHKVD